MAETTVSVVQKSTTEIELLLLCAVSTYSPSSGARIKALLEQTIDWRHLIDLAEAHNMLPLLYTNLSRHHALIPNNTLMFLKVRFVELARRSMLLVQHSLNLMNKITCEGVDVIPYGIPFLTERYLDDINLLTFSSFEFYVSEKQRIPAQRILHREGYKPVPWKTKYPVTTELLDSHSFDRVCDRYTFVKEPEQILVTLSWRLLPPSALATNRVPIAFKRECWRLSGQDVQSFSGAINLLLLCRDIAIGGWRSIGSIAMLTAIVRNSDLDWKEVQQEAENLDLENELLLALNVAQNLSGKDSLGFPEHITNNMRKEQKLVHLSDAITSSFTNNQKSERGEANSPELAGLHFHLGLRKTLLSKLLLLGLLINRPALDDCIMINLPDNLFFLYYLVHPFNQAVSRLQIGLAKLFIEWNNDKDVRTMVSRTETSKGSANIF